MKTIVILVIGVALCFDTATTDYIKDGKEGTESMPSCIQKSMAENDDAVDSVIQFLCLCGKYKNMTDKLVQATEYLEDVTGCSTEDIFGSDTSLEQVVQDKDGALTSQMITMEQLLKHHVPLPITTTVCSMLDDMKLLPDFATRKSEGEIQGKKRTTRNILGLVGALTGGLGGLGGLLKLLSLLSKVLNLLDPVITLLGNLLDGLGGVTNLVGDLGNGLLGGLLGGGQGQGDLLGGLLGGLTGGGQGQGDLLGGLLGGLTGGLTGGLLGR